MKMILILLCFIIASEARAFIRRPTLMLYGDFGHLAIMNSGKVISNKRFENTAIEFVNTGDNRFLIRSLSTGFFLAPKRRNSKFVKLTGTYDKFKALEFQESADSDHYNTYTSKIGNRTCTLIMRPSGVVGLKCRGKIRHSKFLPRRIHSKHLYSGVLN